MTNFDDIIADFSFLDDWDDRYKYLIDLGRHLPEYPEARRDDAHKVKGCASQVWLAYDINKEDNASDPVISLHGDSDAHIVKGLVAVLVTLYSGKTATEISALDANEALAPLSLDGHLTPQRTNGLASMATRIQEIAAGAQQ